MSVANLKPLIPGQTWLTGVGAPNPQFGYKTQFYLDTVTGTIYQKTDTLVWSVAGTMNPSGDAPVKSVNGEIGFVVLDAADVGAIPTSEKGIANGVASLDGTGKVPSSQLPASTAPVTSVNGEIGAVVLDAADVGAIPTSDKGIPNGVASLDATGKVPSSQLPPTPGAPVTSVNGLIGDVVLTSASVGAVAKAGDTMTGVLTMGPVSTGAGETGQIAFKELTANGIYSVTLRAPDQLSDYVVLTLPTSHGTSGQVLTTNGTGILSWTSPGGAVAGTLSHPTSDSTFELNANNPLMTGAENTFIGVRSGYQITTGSGNTGLGVQTLRFLTTGSNNTALGTQALVLVTTGSSNIAIGYQSLQQLNGSSGGNVAIGVESGRFFTNSSNNTFINSAGSSGAIDGAFGNFFAGVGSVFPEEAISGSDYLNWFVLGRSVNKYVLPGKVSSRLVLDRFLESGTYYGGTLSFEGANGGSNKISFSAPFSIPSNVNYTLPASDGSNSQVLTTNGSGVLSWQTPSVSVSGTLSHPTTQSTVESGKQTSMIGPGNTIIGEGTAGNIINASYSTFYGAFIAVGNITGSGNTAFGVEAGYGLREAAYNSIFGLSAGRRLDRGEENVLVGLSAAEYLGSNVLSNGECFGNTILGARAANFLIKGNYNVVVGANSGNIFPNNTAPNNYNTILNCGGGTSQNISGCVLIGSDNSGAGAQVVGTGGTSNQFVLGTSNHNYYMPGTFFAPLTLAAPSFGGKIVLTAFGTSSTITLQGPDSITSSVVYKLPSADGLAGQSLKTDGAGNLYWG